MSLHPFYATEEQWETIWDEIDRDRAQARHADNPITAAFHRGRSEQLVALLLRHETPALASRRLREDKALYTRTGEDTARAAGEAAATRYIEHLRGARRRRGLAKLSARLAEAAGL